MQNQGQVKPLSLDYATYLKNNKSLKNCTIGQYIVQKPLGQGNFGQVYLAKSRRGYQYALKVLDLKQVSEQRHPRVKAIRQRLVESQPRLMQLCNSPNLIKCYDIFQNKDLKVLILQFCNKGTLSDELKEIKKFKQKDAVQVLRNIINGIAELHKHSIVHRDLKTDNIMKHDGVYKIIDFGFSKKLQIQNESEQIKNTLLGTQTTMAPQVFFRKNYGLKADIWSLGIIFFQMVFGIQPYDSKNANKFYQTIQNLVQQETAFNGVILSKDAHDFLQKVLRVNTNDRIGWREMVEHPLIKIKPDQPIAGRFVQREELLIPKVKEQLQKGSLISRQFDFQEENANRDIQKDQEEKIKLQLLENKQTQVKQQKKQVSPEVKKAEIVKPVINPKLAKINLQKAMEEDRQREKEKKKKEQKDRQQAERKKKQSQQAEILSKKGEISQSSSYRKCLKFHLQCLKTQLIFKQIVEPIERSNLINLQSRQSVELMHLLLARCFKNMSPLKLYIKQNPQNLNENKAFRNLQLQIEHLYNEVSAKFKQYDDKLRAKQNKYMEIAKDFVLKYMNGKGQSQKNRILGGVQNRGDQEFGDFTKQQQVEYTCKYIQKIMPDMMDLGEYSKRIKKLLQFYNFITTITLEELGDQTYAEYVERLIF